MQPGNLNTNILYSTSHVSWTCHERDKNLNSDLG